MRNFHSISSISMIYLGSALLGVGCGSSGGSDGAGSVANPVDQPGVVADTLQPTFASLQANVFQPKCVSCHGEARSESGVHLESYAALMATATTHGTAIVEAGNPDASQLVQMVQSGQMPKNGPRLSDPEIAAIRQWVQNGAKND